MHPLRTVITTVAAAVVALMAATTVVGAPGAVASPGDGTGALPTLTELRSARIKLSDLPGDYRRDLSEDSDSSSTSTSTDPGCTAKLEELNSSNPDTAPRTVKKAFRLDKVTGPFVESSLRAWRTKAPAVKGIATIRSLLRACDRWTETDVDGTTAAVRLTRLPMPALGDERVAFRARFTVEQGEFVIVAHADFAVVRVQNAVTFVTVLGFGPSRGVDLVDLTRLSTNRLEAVV